MKVAEIFLSSEDRKLFSLEAPEGVTDVIVQLCSGEKFMASFFSFDKIIDLKKRHKSTNDFLAGTYFWARDMILIENCKKETIVKVIEDLLEEGDFLTAFSSTLRL